MQVDLGRNPHAIRVTTDLLEAVRRGSPGEDHYFLLEVRIWSVDNQRFHILVFAPVTLTSENPFQTEPVGIPDIQLGITHSGTSCQVNFVWRCFQLLGKCEYIIYRFPGTYSTL